MPTQVRRPPYSLCLLARKELAGDPATYGVMGAPQFVSVGKLDEDARQDVSIAAKLQAQTSNWRGDQLRD